MLVTDELRLSPRFHKETCQFEFGSPDSFEKKPSPRMINGHFRHGLMPPSVIQQNNKVVVVMRNPKDVAVSCYHLYKNHPLVKYNGTWDGYFQLFMEGKGW